MECKGQEESKIKTAIEKGYLVYAGEVYLISHLDKDHDLSCEDSMCWCHSRRKRCSSQDEYNKKYRGMI